MGRWVGGPRELLPQVQLRLVETDRSTAGATPSTVGVPGKEAVPTAPVQAAVGHRHLDYTRVGGSIQKPLHSQTLG